MKMEITKKTENPLFKRTEIHFVLDHAGESTPSRGAVLEEIVKQTKAAKDTIVIDNIESIYGNGKSNGYVKVYESKEAALEFEADYLLKRNGIAKPEYTPEEPKAEE